MSGSSTANASAPGGAAPVTVEHLPTPWSPTPPHPRLPIGVAVVSVLIALFAVVMVLAGLLFLLATLVGNVVPTSLEIFQSIDLYGAGILMVLGVSLLVVATSLWRQETWALWVTLILVFGTTAYLFFTGSITVLFLLFVVLFIDLHCVRRYFY